MLSLPQYLNCKTFRYVFCFFCKVVYYTHLLYLFVVANKYLLTYLLSPLYICILKDQKASIVMEDLVEMLLNVFS